MQTQKKFQPLKSKANIIITPSPEDLAKFETIPEEDLKVEKSTKENKLTTFNIVNTMDNQAIIPSLTVMVAQISGTLKTKFGKYQIAELMDVEGNKASINLYGSCLNRLEFENIYTLGKVKKTLIRKNEK